MTEMGGATVTGLEGLPGGLGFIRPGSSEFFPHQTALKI
jgi:hypothetical protein